MPVRTKQAARGWAITGPFRPAGTQGWIADLAPDLQSLADSNEEPYRCHFRLYEGEQLLGPPHALHQTIEEIGRGAYSFWGDVLYFSTSDGSDPNSNGRTYSCAIPSSGRSPVEARPWLPPSRLLRCAIVGLGNRGTALGQLAANLPGVEIAWVIDQSEHRLAEATQLFGVGVKTSSNISEAIADARLDIVIIAVPDYLHRQVAEAAFDAGKHVFLEKPVATTAADAKAIVAAWERSGCILQLGYVLRQAPYFSAIRTVVQEGVLGPIRVATLSEQLNVRHGGTFMRRWHHRSERSGGLMVHKGCHDLDIVCWLLDTKPRSLSSFGGQGVFARPAPAEYCSSCTARANCPYVDNALHERREGDERINPTLYGLDRCVFNSEKDIVDSQVVAFELETGTRGTFTLAMQGPKRNERRILLIGDNATLDGVFEDGRFVVNFTDASRRPYVWKADGRDGGGHGGGDSLTMLDFLDACAGRKPPPVRDSEEALRGVIFAIAAEKARMTATVVSLASSDFTSS